MLGFGRFVIVFNLIAAAFGMCMPWLIEQQAEAKFRDFEIPGLAEAHAMQSFDAVRMDIFWRTVLSVAGVGAGLGIVRRKQWGRKTWLSLCVIWVIVPMTWLSTAPEFSASGTGGLAFRIVLLAISWRILRSRASQEWFQAQVT